METMTESERLCPDGMVCPTLANFLALGLYCVLAAVFITWRTWRTKRRHRLTSWGFVESTVRHLNRFRWSASDPRSWHYALEYAEVRQRYCEAGVLTMFLMHVATSAGIVILAMPLQIKTASRFWFSCWTVFGLWLMLLVAVPRLHQATRMPFGYLLTLAVIFMHQAALDGWTEDFILLSNAPIMMGIVMVAPMAGATPTSAALYSCLGSLSYSMFVSYMYAQSPGNLQVTATMFVGWQHTMGLGILCLGCLCNIILMALSVQVNVERKATLAECEAVSGLLDIVCDAVVELDETGTIISPSPNLSNLLLLSGAPSLQGRQLQQLLHGDEDKRIFREFISEERKTRNAVARHLDMKDSWGSPVRMELFSVTFSGAKSKAKYLVGIKEDRDFARPTGDDGSARGDSKLPLPSSSGPGQEPWSSEGSDAGSVVSRPAERFFEGAMPTSSRALDASLIHIMQTWNLGCGSRVALTCCSYHAAIGTLALRVKQLGKTCCLRDFKFLDGAQCGRCGIRRHLEEWGGGCIMCEIVERYSPRIVEQGPKRRHPASHRQGPDLPIEQDLLGVQAMKARKAALNHAEQSLGEALREAHADTEGLQAQEGRGRSHERPRGQAHGQAQRRHMAL